MERVAKRGGVRWGWSYFDSGPKSLFYQWNGLSCLCNTRLAYNSWTMPPNIPIAAAELFAQLSLECFTISSSPNIFKAFAGTHSLSSKGIFSFSNNSPPSMSNIKTTFIQLYFHHLIIWFLLYLMLMTLLRNLFSLCHMLFLDLCVYVLLHVFSGSVCVLNFTVYRDMVQLWAWQC